MERYRRAGRDRGRCTQGDRRHGGRSCISWRAVAANGGQDLQQQRQQLGVPGLAIDETVIFP